MVQEKHLQIGKKSPYRANATMRLLRALYNFADGYYEDLNGELISKPESREEALIILKKLNGKKHNLSSSVCISKNGSMIWNYTDKAELTMKNFSEKDLKNYLVKISDEALYAYNVYQIEGEGRNLFSEINGDEETIMGLPVKKIKEYLETIK